MKKAHIKNSLYRKCLSLSRPQTNTSWNQCVSCRPWRFTLLKYQSTRIKCMYNKSFKDTFKSEPLIGKVWITRQTHCSPAFWVLTAAVKEVPMHNLVMCLHVRRQRWATQLLLQNPKLKLNNHTVFLAWGFEIKTIKDSRKISVVYKRQKINQEESSSYIKNSLYISPSLSLRFYIL